MKKVLCIIIPFLLSVIIVSCNMEPTSDDRGGTMTVATVPTQPSDPVPETAPTVEPTKEEPKEKEMKEETKESVPVTVPTVKLAPLPEYPAYIVDQCGALWGIPATLQGEYDKVHVEVKTTDGATLPSSEIDVFTLDGVLYVSRTYVDANGDQNYDTYRQVDGVIETATIPTKPEASRVSLHGTKWTIETSIINGVEFSYLYNLDPDMIEAQGSSGGKGARMGAWGMVSGVVELDKGVLIMTGDGALFFPANRACGNPVSEKGRLWR